jgi:hypothetical protein
VRRRGSVLKRMMRNVRERKKERKKYAKDNEGKTRKIFMKMSENY